MIVGFLADKIAYPTPRGWGVYARNLLETLLAIDGEHTYRCFYDIFRSGRLTYVLEVEGVRLENVVWPVPGRLLELLWDRWPLLSAERVLGPIDVLHVPYEFLPRTRSARTVVTVHDVTFLKHPETVDQAFVARFRRRIDVVAERADRVIADSENTRRELLEFTAVPPERVVVIPIGVDRRFRPPVDPDRIEPVLARYGVRRPYLLFVGAADADKNLVRLAQAWARVRVDHGDPQLVLAGRTDWGYRQLLEDLAGLGVAAGVVQTGFVDAADLPLLYAGAEVLAMVSLHEGFGLPAAEAMACGTPVLAAAAASLPEVVGDAGVLVDPYSVEAIADGLARLLGDAHLRARCAARGLERARRFTWEATARRVLQVYEEVAA